MSEIKKNMEFLLILKIHLITEIFDPLTIIDSLIINETYEFPLNNSDYSLNSSNYNNYDSTEFISVVTDGFYNNDTIEGTNNKCHENCETCNEGPTEDNNNCLTCKDSDNIYFDLGNCVSNCLNGYFIGENSTKICKCSI